MKVKKTTRTVHYEGTLYCDTWPLYSFHSVSLKEILRDAKQKIKDDGNEGDVWLLEIIKYTDIETVYEKMGIK